MLLCKTSKPCHIVWYKDSCLIWNSSKYVVSRSGNEARLTIRDVKDSDAGVYECDAGSVSTKATVTVKGISDLSFLYSTKREVLVLFQMSLFHNLPKFKLLNLHVCFT